MSLNDINNLIRTVNSGISTLKSAKKTTADVKKETGVGNKKTQTTSSTPTPTPTPTPNANATSTPVNPNLWTCICGHKENSARFCVNCGKPKPEPWHCVCGKQGNTTKFCVECGKPQPVPWQCACGKVGNTTKFCTECGKPKPEEGASTPVVTPVAPVSDQAPQAPPPPTEPLKPNWDNYHLPFDGLLNEDKPDLTDYSAESEEQAKIITSILSEFKIEAKVVDITRGPVVTMYEILPAPGIKLTKITELESNIALRLAAKSLRIIAPIPGKNAVGIEVPNKKRDMVSFRTTIENAMATQGDKELPIYLGKTITGDILTADLASMPHLLIAGTTGSGKSVCVNSIIVSLLYHLSPAQCRMVFVDPKIVELSFYNDIPHLLTPVITEPSRTLEVLKYCVDEMERRYEVLGKASVRNIKSYNKNAKESGKDVMPYWVLVVDEFADLMMTSGKDTEALIARLAAKSRAVGIHLILATQRPSVNVITGIIKANVPGRIAFMVASNVDSRIILDASGAEKLLGKGDMLFASNDMPFPVRAQGAFVCETEAERVASHLRGLAKPAYIKLEK